MKLVTCKRCSTPSLKWEQSLGGKWILYTYPEGQPHRCNDEELKPVKCKYCTANDLHWAEDVNPHTKAVKMVLTESYGLPHACDERLAIVAKDKQEKKDKYELEKKRVTEHPEGPCFVCKGTGYTPNTSLAFATCPTCSGWGRFTDKTRKSILTNIRNQIWPNLPGFKQYGNRMW